MSAEKDVNIVSSDVLAENELTVTAGNDINITGDKNYVESLNTYNKKSSGLLSKKKTDIYDQREYDQVISSNLSGGTINLEAGNNLNIEASTVVADKDLNLTATGDITIQSLEQQDYNYYNKEEKRSGFMSGGIGFTIGSEKKKDKYINQNTEQVGSMLGSLEGSVTINAGKDVNITASDVIAKEDINIEGDNVNIVSSEHVYNYQELHEYKKTGLTVSLGGYTMNVFNSVYQPIKRAGQVSDNRLQALNYAKVGIAVEKAITENSIYRQYMPANTQNYKLGDKGSFSIDLSFGTSKWKETIKGQTVISQGSNINAGGNINITAREKDINIKGEYKRRKRNLKSS